MLISDFFYIDDLSSGQLLDLPNISQWGKIRWLIFSQILAVITNSTMNGISHDHPGLSRCKFCDVTLRSCDVIKGHEKCFV